MKKILGFLVSTAFTGAVIISCSSAPQNTAEVTDPSPVAQNVTDANHPEERINGAALAQNEPVRSPNLGASSSGEAK